MQKQSAMVRYFLFFILYFQGSYLFAVDKEYELKEIDIEVERQESKSLKSVEIQAPSFEQQQPRISQQSTTEYSPKLSLNKKLIYDEEFDPIQEKIIEEEASEIFDVEPSVVQEKRNVPPAASTELSVEMNSLDVDVSWIQNIFVGTGLFEENIGKVQTDKNGKLVTKAHWSFFHFGFEWGKKESFRLKPSFGISNKKVGDEGSTKDFIFFKLDTSYVLHRAVHLLLGFGTYVNRYSFKSSESVRLNNGSGSSDFFRTTKKRSSIRNTIDLGAELRVWNWLGLAPRMILFSPFDKDFRSNSFLIDLNFYFGLGK